MQNNVLKNTIAPWQEKGRWYHGLWDHATKSFVSEKTDKFILDQCNTYVYSNIYYIYAKEYDQMIIDIKMKFNKPYTISTSTIIPFGNKRLTTTQPVQIAFDTSNTASGLSDLWIFVV